MNLPFSSSPNEQLFQSTAKPSRSQGRCWAAIRLSRRPVHGF